MDDSQPSILIVLPIFLQDGQDKYDGIMRFLCERGMRWSLNFDRLAPTWDRPSMRALTRFDGIIADGQTPPETRRRLMGSGVPLVTLDWFDHSSHRNRANYAALDSDSAEIGRKAAEVCLATDNFACYAFLPQPDRPCWSTDRGQAFVRRLAASGISAIHLDPDRPLAPQLRALKKPAVAFAAHDTIAAKAIRIAGEEGIRIPEDLSILGVDNELMTCVHTNPPLATIQPNFEEAGYRAAGLLHSILTHSRVHKRNLYHIKDVIMRKSLEPASTAGRMIQRAVEFIRDNPLSYRGTDALARQLGVSRRLLDRRFREVMGCSVLQHVQQLRLGEICNLLASTNLSITEICHRCDFGSGTYPQRMFKKHFGESMRAYRTRSKSGSEPPAKGYPRLRTDQPASSR